MNPQQRPLFYQESAQDEIKFQVLMLRYGGLLFAHRHKVVCYVWVSAIHRQLCVRLILLFMGKVKAIMNSFCVFPNSSRAALRVHGLTCHAQLTIKHVLFNQAPGAPAAVDSLKGVIGTVRGR